MSIKPTIVFLMGPTASGKTQLAVQLVQAFPFEIVSVDSAMVYRGMDIGTAKPSADILRLAPHRLIDICDPADAYSAAQFCLDALREIQDIIKKGRTPLLVGGTMLYFRSLQQGLAAMPSADLNCRAQLSAEGKRLGWPVLHQQLQQCDPVAAARIHPHDSQRIQRALEVYILSGKNLTAWQSEQDIIQPKFHTIQCIVAPEDRAVLHERIAQRFNEMLKEGLVEEVEQFYKRVDMSLDLPSMRSVGYRQVWEYLQGSYSYDTMQAKGIIATRQLAKRQLTWLRRWSNTEWFNSSADLFDQVSGYLLSQLNLKVR